MHTPENAPVVSATGTIGRDAQQRGDAPTVRWLQAVGRRTQKPAPSVKISRLRAWWYVHKYRDGACSSTADSGSACMSMRVTARYATSTTIRVPKISMTGPLPSPRPLVFVDFASPSAIDAPVGG